MLGTEEESEGAGGNVSVEREVVTGEGNRIDILIESDTTGILIENKIRAAAGNLFKDYSHFLDLLAGSDRCKHRLLLTLSPSGEGREWGFVNRTYARFTEEVRSMLGHYVSGADFRYLTLLLDFLNTMENLQEGGRMDDRFRDLLSERGNEVEKFRRELLNRLHCIPEVSLPDDSIDRRPTIPLAALEEEAALRRFIETYDWVIEEIKQT